MTDPADLEALLERAVQLEVKTAAAEAATMGRALTADAREDVEAQAREQFDGEVDAELVADLEAGLQAITDQLGEGWEDADFGDDDDPKGYDFEEYDETAALEGKALGGACPSCGDTDVDELVGGGVQCSGCGLALKTDAEPVEHKDFDEPDDAPGVETEVVDAAEADPADGSLAAELGVDLSDHVEPPAEAKSLSLADELARRAALD